MSVKKVLSVIKIVITILLVLVGIALMIFTFASKKDKDSTSIFGYSLMTVLTESMQGAEQDYSIKTMPVGSLVVMEQIKEPETFYASLKKGDVITFLGNEGSYIGLKVTHRIQEIVPMQLSSGVIYSITTHGDNNPDDVVETFVSSDNCVLGKIVAVSKVGGYIYDIISNKYTILFAVIIPATILFVLELLRIIKIATTNKINKQKEFDSREIENLKKQIQELKESKNNTN